MRQSFFYIHLLLWARVALRGDKCGKSSPTGDPVGSKGQIHKVS